MRMASRSSRKASPASWVWSFQCRFMTMSTMPCEQVYVFTDTPNSFAGDCVTTLVTGAAAYPDEPHANPSIAAITSGDANSTFRSEPNRNALRRNNSNVCRVSVPPAGCTFVEMNSYAPPHQRLGAPGVPVPDWVESSLRAPQKNVDSICRSCSNPYLCCSLTRSFEYCPYSWDAISVPVIPKGVLMICA